MNQHRNATILVVDDEAALRGLVSRALLRRGYTVLEAADGQDALMVFEEHSGAIDLLLTDIMMPKMGGMELSQKARAIRPGIKVLYMTGYADIEVLGALTESRAPLLRKPFTTEALANTVRTILAKIS